MPRAAHGMHGSTATRVSTVNGQAGPASTTVPAISWPSTNGNAPPIPMSVGDGPVLFEQVEVAAADPTGRHPDARPGRSGQLRVGQVDERRGERRIRHVVLHCAHE